MKTRFCIGMTFIFLIVAGINAQADIVSYSLEDVILEDNTQMTGTFTWTFDEGNFENGVGVFTSLSIPHTVHDQDDLNGTFDIGKSIEITLEGSTHDDGVDIALVLQQALTPTTSASLDLTPVSRVSLTLGAV